jgi:hypothetical protein
VGRGVSGLIANGETNVTIQEAARAAIQYFPDFGEAVLMTSIMGAESGFEPDAAGDPATGSLAQYQDKACGGKLSFGLGQVFLGVWIERVRKMMQTPQADPCAAAEWLKNPMNNVRMLREIKDAQGWSAWSAYNGGQYLQYYDQATEAVNMAMNGGAAHAPTIAAIKIKRGQLTIVLDSGEVLEYALALDHGIALDLDV